MKRQFIIAALCILCSHILPAQRAENKKTQKGQYRNFPIVVGLQFHNLGLPFKDVGSGFSNPGLRLGTELSYNGRQNWVQAFTIGGYKNKNAGSASFLFTQTIYRPTLFNHFFAEVKAGIGMLHNYHPVDAYQQENGEWINKGRKGKTMLMAPVGVGFGYNGYKNGTYFSPFISYELWVSKDYNDLLPLVPGAVLQIGTRIHLQRKKN